MANIARGFSFGSDNDYIDAARLHALVDTAVSGGVAALVNVDNASCIAGTRLLVSATPSTAFTGDLLVGSDGEIDYYTGAAWANQEPDSIYLVNNSSITVATGTPVILDRTETAATKFTIWGATGNAPDPFGVTLGQVNPNATGQIAFRGKVLMKMNNNASNAGGRVVIFGGSPQYSAGQAQYGYVSSTPQSQTSEFFAVTLQPGYGTYDTQQVMLFK